MNAYKGGVRQKQRELNKQLNEQMQAILNLLD
jgi:BMFP domain-containing protein YqiC